MIALLLALAIPLRATSLEEWKSEVLCQQPDDAELHCRPRVVNLGDFDPRPLDWNTSAFVAPTSSPGPGYAW